jgi:tetratricopeptide (TPR) repeat protein
MRWKPTPILVLLACAAAGCAHARAKPNVAVTTLNMDPITFVAHKDGHVELRDPDDLFEEATAAYQQNRHADALALFDRVATENPGTQHARSSLYNAGLCLEQLDRRAEAVARFRKLADENPDSAEALDALYRMGTNLVLLKDWAASEETHARILKQKNLTLSDRVEAYARLGEAMFQRGRLDDAERSLRELREMYRQHEQEERLDTDYFLAMGAFELAEISHAQYRLLPLRLPQKQLEDDLEAKARMLLLAQQRYIDTMRVRHAEWATAAGFRIGTLYREFYDDLVGAPIPDALSGEAREVYKEQVKKKVRNLLVKAMAFQEKNLLMAERTGEKNDWVRRSNAEMEELRALLEPGPTATPGPREPAPEAPIPTAPMRDVGGVHPVL